MRGGVSLLKKGAEGNDSLAMVTLGLHYKGQGDLAMAREWLKRASERGMVDAQALLTDMGPERQAPATSTPVPGPTPGPSPGSSSASTAKSSSSSGAPTSSPAAPAATDAGQEKKRKEAKLEDVRRVELFQGFNQYSGQMKEAALSKYKTALTNTPSQMGKKPQKGEKLTPIVIEDMDPAKDIVYTGRIISLKVIARGTFSGASVVFLVEDERGESTRMAVYGDRTYAAEVGDLLTVANPHHRLAMDGRRALRVDDPGQVKKTGKIEKPCNACCEGNSRHLCGKCGARYCSKECQVLDWRVYGHKHVCSA